MILTKKTSHIGSISMTLEEFKALQAGEVKRINVEGPTGRPICTVPITPPVVRRLVARSKLLQTNHHDSSGDVRPPDEQAWYWVVNLPKVG